MTHDRAFVPAFGHDLLLPLYDPFTRLLGADRARVELLEQADLRPGMRALEVGCGTGSLLALVGRGVDVVGLDPDPRALERARRKVGEGVRLDRGFADALPYPDRSFDRVFSSFMLHHLPEKGAAVREMARVLRPGGSLHLVDFGGPDAERAGGLAAAIHRSPRVRDQVGDGVVDLLQRSGFADAAIASHRRTWIGAMAWYRARVTG